MSSAPTDDRAAGWFVLPLFAVSILLSAVLLFSIQPMFARMVLPMLGGSPGVWNTAMVFFQGVLLAGYSYAHLLARSARPVTQSWVHLAVLGLGALTLPIAVAAGWSAPADGLHSAWLLALFTVSIGLPFFALSANAPLLQQWFASARHSRSDNPYFLYAASNVGSILALLCYPLIVEPALGLTSQSRWWSAGYAALVALLIVCAVVLARVGTRQSSVVADETAAPVDAADPSWMRRLRWLVLSMVPSSLLLGVTSHLTTDVAAIPLAWVVPLVLYLLTFVIVFARRPAIGHTLAVKVQAYLLILLAVFMYVAVLPLALSIPLHLLAFFFSALVCHGELSRSRPHVSHLTEFYLWMSLGGVLGGAFNALAAPLLFDSIVEYPIAIIAACLLRPVLPEARNGRLVNDLLWPAVLAAALLGAQWLGGVALGSGTAIFFASIVCIMIASIVVFGFSTRPVRFALGIAIGMAGIHALVGSAESTLLRERSFFGTHRVTEDARNGVVLLRHGTTVHGVQSTDPASRLEPLAYYTRGGPIGQFFEAARERNTQMSVGLIGLGAGAVLCYRNPDEAWSVFELDPRVIEIARDTRYFHFVDACGDNTRFVVGDARLSLRDEPAGAFDTLVLDAFSSDAIPMNLISVEALTLYMDKLAPDGVLLAHISNRHVDLEPVFEAITAHLGLASRVQVHVPQTDEDAQAAAQRFPSHWIAIGRDATSLDALDTDERWKPLRRRDDLSPWTDDYSNLLEVFKWRMDETDSMSAVQ